MYAKIINSKVEQYPFYIQTLRQENPNTSFPSNIEMDYATLKEYNVFRVFESAKPSFDDKTQKIVEVDPVEVNGRWEKAWEVIDLSQEEIALIFNNTADSVRSERNFRLQETDWTQAKDISDSVSVLWQPYRQALRDITSQSGFPYNVIWPEKPTN